MRNASLCIFLIMKIAKIIKHEENFNISFACLNKRLVSINRPVIRMQFCFFRLHEQVVEIGKARRIEIILFGKSDCEWLPLS